MWGVGGKAGTELSRAGEALESGKLLRALKGASVPVASPRLERERLLILHRRVQVRYMTLVPV